MKTKSVHLVCPCDSGKSYALCCHPLHQGELAKSALALMRSRYSAYVLGLAPYIMQTWHPKTRPGSSSDVIDDHVKWLGLQVLHTDTNSADTAIVEFVARYKVGGNRAERLHEISEFIFTDAWYYVTGKHD